MLHPLHRGVYAVGRRQASAHGHWMAAVLACGDGAVLSHLSAAALWRIGDQQRGRIEVSLRSTAHRKRPGLVIHRRVLLRDSDVTHEYGIPVTSPIRTLIDNALRLDPESLEQAINEADKYGLVKPDTLRGGLAEVSGEPGVGRMKSLLDPHTFRPTRSYLERRFLPLAAKAGLPLPLTKAWVNGFEVDFFWPDLGLIIETDGLRYHRTPAEQARGLLRDQAHLTAGMTPLRFSYDQVQSNPSYVISVLRGVSSQIRSTTGVSSRS